MTSSLLQSMSRGYGADRSVPITRPDRTPENRGGCLIRDLSFLSAPNFDIFSHFYPKKNQGPPAPIFYPDFAPGVGRSVPDPVDRRCLVPGGLLTRASPDANFYPDLRSGPPQNKYFIRNLYQGFGQKSLIFIRKM